MRTGSLLISILLAAVIALPVASADWTGEAEVLTTRVGINMMEELAVDVINNGPSAVEVLSVAVTVEWEGMPTLYEVFEGSTFLAPGESRVFTGPPTRMPNVEVREYSCFAGVVARGPDGAAVEHRFPSTIQAGQVTLSPPGVPEEVFVPAVLTVTMTTITLLLFRIERTERWPFLRTVPRWWRHQ